MAYPVPPKSKSAVKRAGKAIAQGRETKEDIILVDQWRASHGYVINTFQAWLKGLIKRSGIHADFAQRLKRRKTVFDKLRRKRPNGEFLISDVTSMHDFAGCRLIFETIEDLWSFRKFLRSQDTLRNVQHVLRNESQKYDYINFPKSSGYRGVHEVFRHHPRSHRISSISSEPWQGLLVEIQLRTRVQHAWATALEISDIIDDQRTKFELQDTLRGDFFSISSELTARRYEGLCKAHLQLTDKELCERLQEIEIKTDILRNLSTLRQFEGFDQLRKHNVLNIRVNDESELELQVHNRRNANLAIELANELESDLSSVNAVYVRADNPLQLRRAYQNYFNDPIDFVEMIEKELWK